MTAQRTCGIAGAGIVGRLTGFMLARRGWKVTLFDEGDLACSNTASSTAAGMIAPYCELEYAEPLIARLGAEALAIYDEFLPLLEPVHYTKNGSVVVAHPQDKGELERLVRSVENYTNEQVMRRVAGADLRALEPELDDAFMDGLYFPLEGEVDSRGLLLALGRWLQENAALNLGVHVRRADARCIETDGGSYTFDVVVDARGLKGKTQMPALRGVRGEVVRLHAPEVTLNRPVRMMHPRYPIYIVPRPGGNIVIGATSIEDEDLSPISVRGALELLSAAYSLNSAFSEARIVETITHCRPALTDNLPKIRYADGLVRVNGLYRHGYLLSPKVAALAVSLIEEGKPDPAFGELYEEGQ